MYELHPDEWELVALEAEAAGFSTVIEYQLWLDRLDMDEVTSE